MRLFRKRILKLGNKGLTMVELICAISIMSLLGTVMSGMMIVSADSYRRGSTETELQQEAQLVANQINDLLIDSTAEVTFDSTAKQLKIKQLDGTIYYVQYFSGDKELKYKEHPNGGSESEWQLMAEQVSDFHVDCTDYAKSGSVKIVLPLINGSKTTNNVFTTTSRNKLTESVSVVSADISLSISECLLEPNEQKDFSSSVSLSGVEGGLRWEVLGSTGPVDPTNPTNHLPSGTTISSTGNLTIGANEQSPVVRVHVFSNTMVAGRPAVEKFVNVYIRRVNEVVFDEDFVLISGEMYQAGSQYSLSPKAIGYNFAQTPLDETYVNPETLDLSVSGGATIDSNGIVTLTEELTTGTITVTAKSEHAAGTNRSGSAYGNIFCTKEFRKTSSDPDPFTLADGWRRQSNTAQAYINAEALAQLCAMYGGNQNKTEYIMRYREVGATDWSEWYGNKIGDANASMAINLRPDVTGTLDYRKSYDMEIKFIIYKDDGTIAWEKTIGSTMAKVEAFFTSVDKSAENVSKLSESCALNIDKSNQSINLFKFVNVAGIDIEGTSFENQINYILEKKNGSSYTNAGTLQSGPVAKITPQNLGTGDYRIRVWVANQPKGVLQSDGSVTNKTNVNFELYGADNATRDEAATFYFKITEDGTGWVKPFLPKTPGVYSCDASCAKFENLNQPNNGQPGSFALKVNLPEVILNAAGTDGSDVTVSVKFNNTVTHNGSNTDTLTNTCHICEGSSETAAVSYYTTFNVAGLQVESITVTIP